MLNFLITLFYCLFAASLVMRIILESSDRYNNKFCKKWPLCISNEADAPVFVMIALFVYLPLLISCPFLVKSLVVECKHWQILLYSIFVLYPIVKIGLYTYEMITIGYEEDKRNDYTYEYNINEFELCSTVNNYEEEEHCFKVYELERCAVFKKERWDDEKSEIIFSNADIVKELVDNSKHLDLTNIFKYQEELEQAEKERIIEYFKLNEKDCDIDLDKDFRFSFIKYFTSDDPENKKDFYYICVISGQNKKLNNGRYAQFICYANLTNKHLVIADYSLNKMLNKLDNYYGRH